jgi:hypothetical protein
VSPEARIDGKLADILQLRFVFISNLRPRDLDRTFIGILGDVIGILGDVKAAGSDFQCYSRHAANAQASN